MRIAASLILTMLLPLSLEAQSAEAAARADANASLSADAPDASVAVHSEFDARIQSAMAEARAEGLATALLESRVREGRAKGVSGANIAAAVEQRLSAMLEARQALRGEGLEATGELVQLGTIAIESGARARQVAEVAAAFSGRARAQALTRLADLAGSGRLAADATAAVRGAMRAPLGVDGEVSGAAQGSMDGAGARANGAAGAGLDAAAGGRTVTGSASGATRGALDF